MSSASTNEATPAMDVNELVYEKPTDGAWNVPALVDYKMECCDCCLVHTLDFAITDKDGNAVDQSQFRLAMRVRRDDEATYHKRESKFGHLLRKQAREPQLAD